MKVTLTVSIALLSTHACAFVYPGVSRVSEVSSAARYISSSFTRCVKFCWFPLPLNWRKSKIGYKKSNNNSESLGAIRKLHVPAALWYAYTSSTTQATGADSVSILINARNG